MWSSDHSIGGEEVRDMVGSKEHRSKKKLVVIGANSAGLTAATEARKRDRDVEIIMITDEAYLPYSRCGLPYVLSGEVPSFEGLLLFPPSFFGTLRIDLRLETEVKHVDSDRKSLEIEDVDGESGSLDYDSLILATGAAPLVPQVPGIDKKGVFQLRTLEDGEALQDVLGKVSSAVVVGAGYLGLELAHALVKRGIETMIVERSSGILPKMFDTDMARIVQNRIEAHNVKVMVRSSVDEILGDGRVSGVAVGKKEIDTDIVLFAVGVVPRVNLASEMGIRLGARGGIEVNPRMETSIPDVYAAGDCVESQDMVTGRSTISPLGTTAARQGKVAGINAVGGYSMFPGVLNSVVSTMFGFEVGGTGLTESLAHQEGFETISGSITSKTRAEYYPGGKDIVVKIVAEPDIGRVIGGQVVGGEEVTQRVNLISIAIQNQMSVWELSKADTCYAPSVCTPWEPVILAAETTVKQARL